MLYRIHHSMNRVKLTTLVVIAYTFSFELMVNNFYTPAPRRERGVYCFTSVLPSVQDIFPQIFLSNSCWQKSDIWSQASYRYTILWVAFLDPSESYFLFADLVGFYTHWTYMHIFCQKSDIWSQASYRKHFWTHQIPTSCLPILLIFIHI
jgi:hypothetical protein